MHGVHGSHGSHAVQLTLLRFLNGEVLHDGAPDALPELLRKSLASRHLRAYALLLQFGGASVGDAQRDALQIALRQFGYLLASRRLVNDQLHESLIRALMKDGCWPLRLPHELLAFYARALLTRLAYRATSGGGAAADDDQLVVDVLRGALETRT